MQKYSVLGYLWYDSDMKKMVFWLGMILICGLVGSGFLNDTYAVDNVMSQDEIVVQGTCKANGFFGLVPWYDGLPGDCSNIEAPTTTDQNDPGGEIAKFVWRIVANVVIDLFVVVGYLAIGFIMYGGYMFMISNGDVGKATKGRKILMNAIIGLVIAILANVIIRTILVILGV